MPDGSRRNAAGQYGGTCTQHQTNLESEIAVADLHSPIFANPLIRRHRSDLQRSR